MKYKIEIKPRAMKDLRGMPRDRIENILAKIECLQDNMAGDVKRLTNHTPEYRLRAGDYRVLFEVADDIITVCRVKHRKDAYI
ncbi:MAG: type II toxin-antitoxin system RelE/ParE family toxin [Nitrospinae bacterium]|nr:type II toxin-antitoxin system RelE/ParE family toxin [Nitrospinota bacterium]